MRHILIGGTRSDLATWTEKRIQRYKQAVGFNPETDTLHRFSWEAKLSHRSRVKGAKLLSLSITDPANTTLTGFSHGGNVALLANAILTRRKDPPVARIITIGCPIMGFYKDEYLQSRPSHWIQISSDGDFVQWIASVGSRWSKRRATRSADMVFLAHDINHRDLLDDPATYALISRGLSE